MKQRKELPNEVLFYSSEGGRLFDKDRLLNLSQKDGRNEIRENFEISIEDAIDLMDFQDPETSLNDD